MRLKPKALALSEQLFNSDPRLKILACMGLGLCALKAGLVGLLGFAPVLGIMLGLTAWRKPINRRLLKAHLWFVLIWMAVKMGLDVWAGIPWQEALANSGLLGLRLLILISLGLLLAICTSACSLGLGLTVLLRPLLGKQAWQLALGLALMVHFIPLNYQVVKTVRTAFKIRAPQLAWHRRIQLFIQAVLRYWSQKAWKQTLGLASRGLDRPQAWSANLGFNPLQWSLGALFTALSAWLLLAA